MVFTASDGTKFEDRNTWRRYEFETNYTFRNKQSEKLVKYPGQISGQPFDLSDLTDCEVLLLDQSDQVQLDNLTNCRVFIGPSSESVFVRNCSNCVFTVACKQLRTRDCSNCTFYLYSLTDPIIETSVSMSFAPFNGAYNGIEQHFRDARLEPSNNHWSQIFDFNDPDKSGINWKILKPEEEQEPWTIALDGLVQNIASLGPCKNPVLRDAAFIRYTENDGSGTHVFSFKTSQKDAEKALAATATTGSVLPHPVVAAPVPPPVPVNTETIAPPPVPVSTTEPKAQAAPVTLSDENQKTSAVEAPEPATPNDIVADITTMTSVVTLNAKAGDEPALDLAQEVASEPCH